MNTNSGWIKLHRTITDWEWYKNLPVKVLYIHLLLKANHEPGRRQGAEIERGELISSVSHLAQETGLSVAQVRLALKKLTRSGEIIVNTTNSFSRIKCLNYAVYQARELEAQQTDSKQITNEKQTDSNKQEYKKNKKNKNSYKRMKREPSFDIEEIARQAKLNDDYDI